MNHLGTWEIVHPTGTAFAALSGACAIPVSVGTGKRWPNSHAGCAPWTSCGSSLR